MRPSRATEQLVMYRSEAHCESGYLCGGAYLAGVKGHDWDIHHRAPAKSGGSTQAWIHAPSNLIAICRADHIWIESERDWAIERGLLLEMGLARALTTAVDLRHGLVLLDDIGTWTAVS